MGWSKTEDERLIELWRDRLSLGEIAWEFPGRTRNACIGRLTRLRKQLGAEMVPPGRTAKSPAPAKKKRSRKTNFEVKGPYVPRDPTPEKIAPLPPAARQLTLLELGPKDCRFIVSGAYTRQHLYCAADASLNVDAYGNDCYCPYHRKIMRVRFVRSV